MVNFNFNYFHSETHIINAVIWLKRQWIFSNCFSLSLSLCVSKNVNITFWCSFLVKCRPLLTCTLSNLVKFSCLLFTLFHCYTDRILFTFIQMVTFFSFSLSVRDNCNYKLNTPRAILLFLFSFSLFSLSYDIIWLSHELRDSWSVRVRQCSRNFQSKMFNK